MSGLPPAMAAEVRRVLGDVAEARLASSAWPAVVTDLDRLRAAIDTAEPEQVTAALLPVSRSTFEGKVRGRLAHADGPAAMVVATKPTSALPAVGIVSAALLVGIGYLLGGWAVAALTSVFALFIFGVALAGTHTTKERLDQRAVAVPVAAPDPVVTAPPEVAAALADLEERISG